MTARPRLPLTFGGGLDRYTGTAVAQPVSFRDVRNVHLRAGGSELREGIGLVNSVGADADMLIGVFPIRSQGIGASVFYRIATREVKLYLTSADGSVLSYVGVVWTLAIDAAIPRVLAAEMVDRLVLAHDEPIYAKRQVTKVYDPGAGTLTNLQADLYLPTEPPTLVDVRFRGVMSYLEYLVGWGYGSENVGDDNLPEVVRVSKPGELAFVAEHYFIAGSRGDPVMMCAQAGNILEVQKPSSTFQITGYDRATFGIKPLDKFFGLAGSRLSITIGGVNYRWSLEGPRRSEGGLSEDLGLPLDLGGPSPDALAEGADLAYGFAVYRPERREIEFIFGRWSYVYHMAEEGAERWSFRQYGVELTAGGVLYDASASSGTSGGIGSPAYPNFVNAAAGAPAAGTSLLTVNYSTQNGPLLGGEVVELWAKSRFAGDTWARIGTGAAAPVAGAITGNVVREGITYDVAVRFTYVGIPSAGYTSANPFDWPVAARGTVQTGVEAPTLGSLVWTRASAVAHGHTINRTGGAPYATHAELTSILEWSHDNVTWNPLAAQALGATVNGIQLANAEASRQLWYRMRDQSSEGVSSAYSAVVTSWAGPVSEIPVAWFDPMIFAGKYEYDWDWPPGADASWHLELTGHSTSGFDGATHSVAYPTTTDFPDAPCGAFDVTVKTRTWRVQFGITDYGELLESGFIPSNC